MFLSQMKKGEEARIININADKSLRDRLRSFAVMRGETLKVKGCSLGKQTMEIEVGGTLLALRAEEAEKIEIEKI